MESLLRFGETIATPATEPFVASANFVLNMRDAGVRIGSVLTNFARWYSKKSEAAGPPTVLDWYELQDNASNSRILTEFGSASGVETTLAAAYWLMLQQPAGQPGPLASNGWANVFYVRDAAGQLRSLYIHWCGDSWSIDAMPIETTTEWSVRDRVFRPKS